MTELALSPRREVFDASLLATTERFDAWKDAVNAAFVPLSVASPEPGSFNGSLICQGMGTTHLSEVSGSASQVRRTSREIADNDPGLIKLGLQLRGYSVVAQDGREAALTPGDFAIYDTSRPYDLYFDDSFRMLVVHRSRLAVELPAAGAAGPRAGVHLIAPGRSGPDGDGSGRGPPCFRAVPAETLRGARGDGERLDPAQTAGEVQA